jgi:predicted RND superfamily exporter protein/(2Fe-2S) ferredoxin
VTGFLGRWVFGRTGGMRHGMLSWPLALLVVVTLHAVSAYLLVGLKLNNAPEVYFAPGSPAVVLRDDLRRDFPTDETLTILFQGGDLYEPSFLRKLHDVAQKLEQHPLVDRVTTVLSFERISGASDGFAVTPLVDAGQLGAVPAEALRQRVLADRFAPGLLASRDGQALALVVRPVALGESTQRLALRRDVLAAIDDAGLRPHVAGDAGQLTLDVAQFESIVRDTQWLVPLTVVIGLALLGWAVGRLRPVVIGAAAMSTVVAPAVAGVVVFGQPYTMATVILPSLLAAYTVATLLHLYAGVQRAQGAGASRAEAVDRALGETRRPSAFNVLTTGAGLLSLVLVPIPPIQVLGIAGAAGTLLVFLTVFFLVPPFLRHWDQGRWPQHSSGMGRLGRLARRLALLSMRWPKTVVVALAVAVAAAASSVMKVESETDLLAFFADDHPVNVDTRRIEKALTGVTTLEVSLRGGDRDAFQSVATLRRVKQFQQWLESLPEVDRTVSMVDLVEEMHWAMNGERPALRALPPNDRLLRQYLLVYDGTDLYELVNRDFDHARIVLNLNVHGSREIGRTIEAIRAHLATDPVPGVRVDVGGYGRLLADQVELLVDGQLQSFAGAFGQIFLLIAVLFRSAKAAAICMAPNLAPLYFVFALMGAVGVHLDLATVMIAGVVLGITVDDTIHLYHGYRTRVRAGVHPLFAAARSYEAAGRAVLATSAVLIAQFALLTASDFIPTSNFGLMTAAGLLTGLLFEVLLLPALLVLGAGLPWTWRSAFAVRRPRRTTGARPTGVQDAGWFTTSAPPAQAPEFAPTVVAGDAVPGPPRRVLVCHGDACKRAGAPTVWRRLRDDQALLKAAGRGDALHLVKTSCLGLCTFAPVVHVYPDDVAYGLLDGPQLDRVVDMHLHQGQPVAELRLPTAPPTHSTR